MLSPVLFTLYTLDFKYNSEFCYVQKFADDTAIVRCIRNRKKEEHRMLIQNFATWYDPNHLHHNTTNTKERVVDFIRSL